MWGAMMAPQMMSMYTQYMFTIAFGAGGYAMGDTPYKVGEYTVWLMPNGNDKASHMERAYLGDDASGNQWWRVKFTTEGEKDGNIVLEGLFTKDLSRLVRLRGKMPNDTEGKEMPVDEQSYYMAPRRLSKESVAGATKGVENVTVPAGTFSAGHVVYGDGGGGTHEWWLSDKVPGGLVKHITRQAGESEPSSSGPGSNAYQLSLEKFGADAKSELGSK
jgi:hypothetical protein